MAKNGWLCWKAILLLIVVAMIEQGKIFMTIHRYIVVFVICLACESTVVHGASPTTRNADSLLDFVNRFSVYNESSKSEFRQYRYNFEDLPDAIMYANGMKPIEADSEYKYFVNPSEYRYTNVYPTPNARARFEPGPNEMIFTLRNIDITNGAVAEGPSKIYWALRRGEYRNDGALFIDAMFLEDSIVYSEGKPQYRAERVIRGYFCPVGKSCIGNLGIVASFPGEFYFGHMQLTITQIFDERRGYVLGQTILELDIIMQREDNPTGYPDGGTDGSSGTGVIADKAQVLSIGRLYKAAFDRLPEVNGLNFWVNSFEGGQSIVQIASRFVESPEFSGRYGNLNDTNFVRQLYRNVLGREGEQSGITYWVGLIKKGTSRAKILERFSASPENVTKTQYWTVSQVDKGDWSVSWASPLPTGGGDRGSGMVPGSGGSGKTIAFPNVVEKSGRIWAQVDLFTNLSWNEINAVCPARGRYNDKRGVCINGGILNGYAMTGWTWAGQNEVEDLFNGYGVSPPLRFGSKVEYEPYPTHSQWAQRWFNSGVWRPTQTGQAYSAVRGFVNFSSIDFVEVQEIWLGSYECLSNSCVQRGVMYDRVGANRDYDENDSEDGIGAWFYK